MARGDQIYVMRELFDLDGAYEHHGIDCGDGSVIHYRKPSETIERTSIDVFAKGGRVFVRPYQVCYIPDTVILRAESRLGERQYNLLFNNCEHFATWCKTGLSESLQVRNFIPVIQHLDPEQLAEPIKQALKTGTTQQNASQLRDKALGEIRTTWNEIQPEYNELVKEMNVWDRVAKQALKQNREDLARRAIERKVSYKQRAIELKTNLDRLAAMTENLIKTVNS
jgi:Lecithin retinol acyltransferase/PspA/IM30 family